MGSSLAKYCASACLPCPLCLYLGSSVAKWYALVSQSHSVCLYGGSFAKRMHCEWTLLFEWPVVLCYLNLGFFHGEWYACCLVSFLLEFSILLCSSYLLYSLFDFSFYHHQLNVLFSFLVPFCSWACASAQAVSFWYFLLPDIHSDFSITTHDKLWKLQCHYMLASFSHLFM